MSDVSNADIYHLLCDVKEDIGGLKATTELQLEGLKNHSQRIASIETEVAAHKGSMKMLATLGAGASAVLSSAIALGATWLKTRGHP